MTRPRCEGCCVGRGSASSASGAARHVEHGLDDCVHDLGVDLSTTPIPRLRSTALPVLAPLSAPTAPWPPLTACRVFPHNCFFCPSRITRTALRALHGFAPTTPRSSAPTALDIPSNLLPGSRITPRQTETSRSTQRRTRTRTRHRTLPPSHPSTHCLRLPEYRFFCVA
jgi:hypothetical protein